MVHKVVRRESWPLICMYDQIILYDKTSTAENSFKWRSLFSQSNVLAVITFFFPSMQRISLIQDDKLEIKQGE